MSLKRVDLPWPLRPTKTQTIAGIHLKSDVSEKLTGEIRLRKLVDLNHSWVPSILDKFRPIERALSQFSMFWVKRGTTRGNSRSGLLMILAGQKAHFESAESAESAKSGGSAK